ncbi:transient receptor potential cation channel subfamily M member 2-like isoform X1 [Xiphophorus hellerii]|uniref:transient receptor potential cation channel subfamily M member 2-like isoform X1 n=1 Tax=Xiphophorus hellerii TaxID=8084 RepID=UPI0013B3FB81|nr:transient receptor potential cation channel subfamily M member 2-like isoform X1 [Xiphophorus hellerii]
MSDAQGGTKKNRSKKEINKDESIPLKYTPRPSATSPSSSSASNIQDNVNQQISTWIKNNITKKQCCPFKKDASNKEVCCCEYSELDSIGKASKPEDFKKHTCNEDKHVHEVSTDAFGEINFGGFWKKSSKYVRVFTDTRPKVLYELLTKQWKLPPPNLVISVTGGANNFYLKSHLTKAFHRGLIKVAQTTGAWIITGGTHSGVMMHVGQAVRDCALNNTTKRKIVAIGVAPWGVIHNKDKLINEEGCFPAHYVIDKQGQGDLVCLDDNHSHLLLVDDGTSDKKAYGAEIPLRTELEQYISDRTLGTKATTIKTLVVCVVLDGGEGTLKTIYSSIEKGTPCVILQGSGRIADVIAHASGFPISRITTTLIKELTKKFFGEEYKNIKDDQIEAWKNMIHKIVEKPDLLTIFRARKDDQGVLDVAILDALLKAFKTTTSQEDMSWKKHLELAITWNRVDSAETKIFTEEKIWKSSELHRFMYLALVCNKPDFVSLLLENGVCLEDFLDDNTLCELYKNLPNCLFLYKLFKKVKFTTSSRRKALDMKGLDQARKNISLKDVSIEVRHLLGKFTKHIYPSSKDGEHTMWIEDRPYRDDESKRDAARDLFLWAVVQNNKELSKIAWDQCGDCMSAALAASKILKKMAKESIDADEPQEMLELANYFEDRAIGVFSECYKNNEERAQKLLVRISHLWGETTCLRLALEANDKNFVAELGVQDRLTQIWCGDLSVNNPVWRVLICMVFFPLTYTKFLAFRCDEVLQREIEQKEWIKMTGEEETKITLNNNSDCSKQNVEPLGCLSRLKGLYSAPQVKFYGNIVSYFAFLFLFAYVLMIDFQSTPSIKELVLYIWLFTLVSEEIRQLFYDPDHFGFCEKAKVYIQELWNILDVISIVLFCVGLGLRMTKELFYPGKIILCIDFVVFCLRLMAIFTINRTLGPKIIIVKKMMMDMFFFMFLLSIWVVAYGVAKQGILIHNDDRLDWIIRGAVYEPYLIIFGSFPENIDKTRFDINSCSMDGTDPMKPKCPVLNENQMTVFPEWLTIIMLCIYLLCANILLINLLIAIFNYSFEEVHDNTDRIWKFQRYQLIKEYYSRPPPPPPFIIFSHLYLFIKTVLWKAQKLQTEFKVSIPKEEEDVLLSWEALMRDTFVLSERQAKSQSMEGHIQDSSQKVTTLTERLEKLEEQSNKALESMEDIKKSQGDSAKETVRVATLSEQQKMEEKTQIQALLNRMAELEEQVTNALQRRMDTLEGQVTKALQRIEDSLKSLGAPAKESQPQSTVE